MKNYEFGLFKNGVMVDSTGLDEDDVIHAKFLFYEEFGHKKEKGDEIKLRYIGEEV